MLSQVGLQITGFDQVEHGEPWHKNMELFKAFTDVSQGVRRSGAAAIDMCHVACGMDASRLCMLIAHDLHWAGQLAVRALVLSNSAQIRPSLRRT